MQRSRKTSSYFHLVSILVGFLLSICLFSLLSLAFSDFRADARGLGMNTVSVVANYKGHQVSDLWEPRHPLMETFEYYRDNGYSIALWVGNSQLHAINRISDNDKLAVEWANRISDARNDSLVYLQVSIPNASMNDFLAYYLSFREQGYIPDYFIAPITFDDLRETRITRWIIQHIPALSDEMRIAGGQPVSVIEDSLKALASLEANSNPVERNPTAGTPQEKLEMALIDILENHWDGFRNRGNVISAITFHIRTLWLRLQRILQPEIPRAEPIPRALRDRSFDTITALASCIQADGSQLFLYQPPHRPNEPVFYYQRDEYDSFYETLKTWCDSNQVLYSSFESLVPEEYWGYTNEGYPDVFHFQGYGHQLLGREVDSTLNSFRRNGEVSHMEALTDAIQ